jgi:hypothetical protein
MTFKDGWSYSNGCSQEFTRAMLMQWGFVNRAYGMLNFPVEKRTEAEEVRAKRMKVFDEGKSNLDLASGMHALTGAVASLHSRGFDASMQVKCLGLLDAVLNTCYYDPMGDAEPSERYDMSDVRDLRTLYQVCLRTQNTGDYKHIAESDVLRLFADVGFAREQPELKDWYRVKQSAA